MVPIWCQRNHKWLNHAGLSVAGSSPVIRTQKKMAYSPFFLFSLRVNCLCYTLRISVSCAASNDVSSQDAQRSTQRAASGFGFLEVSRYAGSLR